MIRSLRRRFILGAMAAFGILLFLLLCAVTVAGYIQVEHSTGAFLEAALKDAPPRRAEDAGAHGFGARDFRGGGYYLLSIGVDKEITDVEARGVWEEDCEEARAVAEAILDTGADAGRSGVFRYRVRWAEDGSGRMALMDASMQMRMLADLLRTAGLIFLCCLGVLFLILLPVSAQVVRSYASNIERQKQFITNAGHEIKTPVAIIMSNVDALELIQGESRWSRNIRGQTERLSALLKRLLFMARIDESSLALHAQPLELEALIRAELAPYAEMMEERSIRFECALCGPVPMRGSREYLRQLMHMLLDNAVRYANEGGEIVLKLERRRQRARIALFNTVDALPDCPGEALFDRFYRGDPARTQRGGSYGVGLSAARAIAEMHRGRITAEYEGAHGIRFTVELPLRM